MSNKNIVLTIAWLITLVSIPVFSYFGRDLLSPVLQYASRYELAGVLGAATAGLIGGCWYWLSRVGGERVLMRVACVAVGAGIILFIVPPGERWLHVPLFGLFGFLSTRLLGRVLGLIVALSVGAVDELWQHFLPDRNGDPVDVAINAVSATLGIVLALPGKIAQRKAPNDLSRKSPNSRER